MAELAESMGVEIYTGEPVTGFDFVGQRPKIVHTASSSYPADAVIINADFAQAMHDLVPNAMRRRWNNQRINTKKFSCSTFMLYLGIRGKYDHLPHHTIHITEDYTRNLRQIEDDFVLPDAPSFYIQNAVQTDDSLAPPDHSALYILVPVPHMHPNTPWDAATVNNYRELVLDQLAHVGLKDIRERIVTERIHTPRLWQEEFGLFRGATFNLAHNLGQMLHLRPHNRFEDLEHVYLVGGGTHPGSGLPVIYESSRITCKQLIPRLGLDPEFLYNPPSSRDADVISAPLANAACT
jgi:phytoene desaturase